MSLSIDDMIDARGKYRSGGGQFQPKVCSSPEELLARPDVQETMVESIWNAEFKSGRCVRVFTIDPVENGVDIVPCAMSGGARRRIIMVGFDARTINNWADLVAVALNSKRITSVPRRDSGGVAICYSF